MRTDDREVADVRIERACDRSHPRVGREEAIRMEDQLS
jgi:hypothetical protein